MRCFVATVPPEQLQDNRLLLRFHKAERSCSPRLEKLSLFSPPSPCAKRMAREFRCLRAAIRATRPHLANIFEKLLEQKTFGCLRLVLGKPPESGSARLGHIPSLPWESQLPLKPCFSLQYLDLKDNCDSYDSLLDFFFRLLCSFICSANVGYSP